jgi:DNA-binding MarR family transcriptional regulator
MPEPEFRSCFVQLAAPEQNQSDQSPSSRPRIEEPVYQSAQTDSNQPSDIAESDDSIVDDEAIESEEAIATNEEIEIEQPDTEELAVSEEYDEPSFDDAPAVFPSSSSALRGPRKIRSAGGISPQMGRILVAMHHLAANGQRDVLTNSIQGLVSPVDSKQVSGMIHGAIKAGYVDKGDSATGRASYYSLTKSGKKLAENLGTWPWDVREMAYPPWLSVEQLANA